MTPVFDAAGAGFRRDAAVAALAESGVIVLRNLLTPAALDEIDARAAAWLAKPAAGGVPGYSKVDAPKKLITATLLGGAIYDAMADGRVVGLIEEYMGGECILAEANVKFDRGVGYGYFPIHTDFAPGWRKTRNTTPLAEADLELPVGVGGVMYLHDTTEGGFCYCLGTHRRVPRRPGGFPAYTAVEQAEILASKVRVDGRRGDLVLFDDRGFHGPDQPSRADRTVLILDYYRVASLGRYQVMPLPVWTSDLARLDARALRLLGAGGEAWVTPFDYTGTRFRQNWAYPLVTWLIENAYGHRHIADRLRQVGWIANLLAWRRRLRTSKGMTQ